MFSASLQVQNRLARGRPASRRCCLTASSLPRASLRRCAVIVMPYEGKSVSILEMLDILTSNERSEAEAAIELERAFEDREIRLLAPAGSADDGTPVFRAISIEETSGLIGLLRDLCNRKPITTIGTWNLPIGLFKSARAMRTQFEGVCRLAKIGAQAAALPREVPMSRKDAVRTCIEAGMTPASTVTWDAFCEQVRDLADGWIDKKVGTIKRGFDEKTIKRDVKEIMN